MELTGVYAERVYAGVLGKAIGVYLGRPFEGWPYEAIQKRLGNVSYYVHDQVGVPLLVTDDDLGGTFTFPRAIVDSGYDPKLRSEQIGEAWLNYLIEGRTVLWWGGLGNSTEHTAYLRLKSGVPAPRSGSMETNSQIVAEQIGAQIFIDGWAMVSPGDAAQAARLAEQAARVSHDGAAVHAAVVIAVMEAMAFVESDLGRLLETALGHIPADSVIRRLIDDVRRWSLSEADWRATRERLEARYGYHLFGGNCHVVPNHGLIVLALLYGEDNFSKSLEIVNSCGWDTDCNSGNVGCLLGIKNGLAGIDAGLERGLDWRGPVADRLYVCSADPTWGVSDCLREAQGLVSTARRMSGVEAWAPKQGAQFHFEMPGAVQGFTVTHGQGRLENVSGVSRSGRYALRLEPEGVTRFGTPVFIPSGEVAQWAEGPDNPYQMTCAPRLYPGQTVSAALVGGAGAEARLYVRYYDSDDQEQIFRSEPEAVDAATQLSFEVPPEAYPAFEVGVETGETVHLDSLRWDGEPRYVSTGPQNIRQRRVMWRRSWVDGVDEFVRARWVRGTRLVQNRGRGLLMQGTRDWRDIAVTADVTIDLAVCSGVAVRVQGMRRYYALLLQRGGEVRLVKVLGEETVLASLALPWVNGQTYELSLRVRGNRLAGFVDGEEILSATDAELACGGLALVIEEGCSATSQVAVAPA